MSKQLFIYFRILTSCLGVWGVSTLIAFPAFSQSSPVTGGNTNLRGSTYELPRLTPGMSNINGTTTDNGITTGPYGSRLNANGTISTSSGQLSLPSATVTHSNGSTTYYYSNGSSVTVDKTKIPPTGVPVR